MRKVYQTKFGKEGNCFDACLASLFEIPLDRVPHFNDFGDEWFQEASLWCLKNFGVYLLDLKSDSLDHFHGYLIVGVTSPNHLPHVVIVKDGVVVHDPLDERLVGSYDLAEADAFIVAIDPMVNIDRYRDPYRISQHLSLLPARRLNYG